MNKNFKIFSIIAMLTTATLFSCSEKFDTENLTKEETNKNEPQATKEVNILLSMNLDTEMCKEVYGYVERSIGYGLDEEVRFIDILNPNNRSKLIDKSQTPISTKFRDKLLQVENQLLTRSDQSGDLIFNDSEIQIYWPYSEYWDGQTVPVITYAPEDKEQNWNYGYKKVLREDSTYNIEVVTVDEEYAMNNPVWIINSNETPYENLPNFNEDSFVANSCMYVAPKNRFSVNNADRKNAITTTTDKKVYTVYLGKLKATKQYDSWFFGGGSEFVIQMGQANNYAINSSNLTSLSMNVTMLRVSCSRNDIEKKRWKNVNAVLNSDWLPEENDAAFMIHEDDGGGSKKWESEISVTWQSKNYSAIIKLPYKDDDDMVYKTNYSRNFIFSTNNSPGTVHSAHSVYWTLPYEIGRVVE